MPSWPPSGSPSPPTTRSASSRGRCTTGRENADSREIGLRDALVIAPLAACIVALALYPGLILGRADKSVEQVTASVRPETDVVTQKGWTGYAPIAEISK